MDPKISKLNNEIVKITQKISNYQSRLKELERKKTELENTNIVAMVRGVEIPPAELEMFIKTYIERGLLTGNDDEDGAVDE